MVFRINHILKGKIEDKKAQGNLNVLFLTIEEITNIHFLK
jgi:hypothetical protein